MLLSAGNEKVHVKLIFVYYVVFIFLAHISSDNYWLSVFRKPALNGLLAQLQ